VEGKGRRGKEKGGKRGKGAGRMHPSPEGDRRS